MNKHWGLLIVHIVSGTMRADFDLKQFCWCTAKAIYCSLFANIIIAVLFLFSILLYYIIVRI